jgi:hypothetical protein
LIEIVTYSNTYRAAVDRMNMKLSAAGSEWQFPAEERPHDADELPIWMESFIAVENDDAYGGYLLKHQRFFVQGRPYEVGDLQLPLSLGQVDTAFSHVSAALLIDVLRRSPLCYSLGLGSPDSQFAKLLAAAGWKHMAVPFYFSVKSPNRFAKSIRLSADRVRTQRILRLLGSLRLAGSAFWLRRALQSRSSRRENGQSYDSMQEVSGFGASADELFAAHNSAYSLVGDRRAAPLNSLYPEDEPKYIRVSVEKQGRVVGWAVLLDTEMHDDKHFGNLRLGTLVDCFAAVEDAPAVVAAADDVLTGRGVDLVVSNQLHPEWCEALAHTGYELGPSNFFFYYSEELAEVLSHVPAWEMGLHMNRGDGEGPSHL